jgi:hypothetical protein
MTSWKNNSGVGAFHIRTTPHSIKIDCYGTEGKTMDVSKHNGRIQMSAL